MIIPAMQQLEVTTARRAGQNEEISSTQQGECAVHRQDRRRGRSKTRTNPPVQRIKDVMNASEVVEKTDASSSRRMVKRIAEMVESQIEMRWTRVSVSS